MKYYIYISDTKLDMLYPQIPRKILERISVDLSINLGMINVNLKNKDNEKSRFDKLRIVTEYIKNNESVGSIDAPLDYFEGELPMRWGPLSHEERSVYFGGKTDSTWIGLAGSISHVVGSNTGNKEGFASMTAQSMLFNIEIALRDDATRFPEYMQHSLQTSYIIYWATSNISGPEQKLEFLAKRLHFGDVEDQRGTRRNVLLGTPLYVSLAE